MNDIQVFDFEDNAVRVVDIDGEPWFVAADVCRVLELSNPSKACADLDDDEAALTSSYSRSSNGTEQKRDMLIISESGLYNLIFRSRKPEAKKFRKWVTAEVLPSIRKTGMYVAPEMDCRAPDGARNDGDGFADLPDRTFQQWINLVRETRLLFGRDAACWFPIPKPMRQQRKAVDKETEKRYIEAIEIGFIRPTFKEHPRSRPKLCGGEFYRIPISISIKPRLPVKRRLSLQGDSVSFRPPFNPTKRTRKI